MGQGYRISAKANEADVLIYEDVGDSWFGGVSAKQFADDLKALGKVDTINLRLNSAGGDVFDGLAIYRQLVDHPARVITHIDGIAASIASVIAMAGTEIRIAEAGFLMIHDAWGMQMGNADDMRRMADLLHTTTGSIADVYKARTPNTPAQIKAWMAAETWFTAAEAIDNGFASVIAPGRRQGRGPAQVPLRSGGIGVWTRSGAAAEATARRQPRAAWIRLQRPASGFDASGYRATQDHPASDGLTPPARRA